ncbi:MAG TPA: fluoride efflux transporter CrcB [Blastocatellia bacterium]|nr:fluoride efflux transporter CrcB [Blastocatellia bacterium]
MITLDSYLAVALGGALGAMSRHWINTFVGTRYPTRFPYSTLIINVTGSFIIGLFLTLVNEKISIHPNWRLGFAVGFVGAYTTFSTFEYETFNLIEKGASFSALANVVISLTLGFVAVWGGIVLARKAGPPLIPQRLSRRAINLETESPKVDPALIPHTETDEKSTTESR